MYKKHKWIRKPDRLQTVVSNLRRKSITYLPQLNKILNHLQRLFSPRFLFTIGSKHYCIWKRKIRLKVQKLETKRREINKEKRNSLDRRNKGMHWWGDSGVLFLKASANDSEVFVITAERKIRREVRAPSEAISKLKAKSHREKNRTYITNYLRRTLRATNQS